VQVRGSDGNKIIISRQFRKEQNMAEQFFEEEIKHYNIEFLNVEDIAENGEHADIKRNKYMNELPPMDMIEEKAKEMGYDNITIEEVTTVTKCYSVE
jgi:hypothetical protein